VETKGSSRNSRSPFGRSAVPLSFFFPILFPSYLKCVDFICFAGKLKRKTFREYAIQGITCVDWSKTQILSGSLLLRTFTLTRTQKFVDALRIRHRRIRRLIEDTSLIVQFFFWKQLETENLERGRFFFFANSSGIGRSKNATTINLYINRRIRANLGLQIRLHLRIE